MQLSFGKNNSSYLILLTIMLSNYYVRWSTTTTFISTIRIVSNIQHGIVFVITNWVTSGIHILGGSRNCHICVHSRHLNWMHAAAHKLVLLFCMTRLGMLLNLCHVPHLATSHVGDLLDFPSAQLPSYSVVDFIDSVNRQSQLWLIVIVNKQRN